MMSESQMGMSVMAAIHERRSVRSYSPYVMDQSIVRSLLAAAVRAPTAKHEEPWIFAIVQDNSMLKRLSDLAKKLMAESESQAHVDRGAHPPDFFNIEHFNIFYNSGTLVVICGKPLGEYVVADCWLAAENLMLAAFSMGLGTCVIGSAVSALNRPEIKSELNIPSDVRAIAPIIIGVPEGETGLTPRKEPHICSWN
ncbi:MAG TPA: nitroreductase family protein [Burkholderiales bacterium]|nr:nitroreductase family protein [Burkholderiales bacterium]